MKLWLQFLSFTTALLLTATAFGGQAKPWGNAYPLQYQGGNLPLKLNHGVKAVLGSTQIVLEQDGRRFVVPVRDINQISCATDIHRRFGASVLALVPLVDLDKVEEHYVGVTFTDNVRRNGKAGTMEVVFKLSGGEYRDFIATLERLTGKKAVDTNKTPTAVRYD